ncbi:ATP-binding protein [Streptomyces albireticuli]|uniref:ATP-binding protein n=1 Tax=Streptomyces albireticuli TaxID=1940 RepID=A0A1Z2L7Y5_9ACTN|nr:ATP-binding protein [Streptomyces albireticuli]
MQKFDVGDRVAHDRYGLGRVIGVEEDIAVLVDFATRQERIPGPYTKLTKL